MKILIITQKVNKDDSVLGFFIRWIEEFAKQADEVTVICLEEGKHSLPMRVLSLGKEKGAGKLVRVFRLYKYIWQYRKDYDAVFVHMNQIYVILCWLPWFLMRKKISLWYAHGKVSFSLKIANLFCRYIFTSTENGLNLQTKKRRIVGQGIDTELFKPNIFEKENNRLITVGRISVIKNVDKIIDILEDLNDFYLDIVGIPIYQNDFAYNEKLKIKIKDLSLKENIIFSGSVNQENLPKKYNQANIFINLSDTGSLDKVILEAMSCGLHIVTTNKSARELENIEFIENFDKDKIVSIIKNIDQNKLNLQAREFVVKNHSMQNLISKIIFILEK